MCGIFFLFIETGEFTLINPKSGIYSAIYEELDGKYIYLDYFNLYNDNEYNRTFKVSKKGSEFYFGEVTRVTSTKENSLIKDTDESGPTYYYRGGVTNNYINFNDMC